MKADDEKKLAAALAKVRVEEPRARARDAATAAFHAAVAHADKPEDVIDAAAVLLVATAAALGWRIDDTIRCVRDHWNAPGPRAG